MHDFIILGAGAAGMIGAIAAKEAAREAGQDLTVVVLEKNPRPGIKVLVCGGGRCNFTNAGSIAFLIEQFGRDGRFLAPALRHLSNDGLRAFFTQLGVPSHEEHDGKIYPDSNQARSVVDALVNRGRALGVEYLCGAEGTATGVRRAASDAETFFAVDRVSGAAITGRRLLIAVGGMSYQRMGTTGDGYTFAKSLGHSIVTPRPAIVGLLTKEPWVRDLQGVAVRDVDVQIAGLKRSRAEGRKSTGDMLFTHFGLSGPAVLNVSEIVAEMLEATPAVEVHIDFQRHMTHDSLAAMLRSWQQHHGKKLLRKMLCEGALEIEVTSTSPDRTWADADAKTAIQPHAPHATGWRPLPRRWSEQLLALEAIPAEQPCATLSSAQMHRLVERMKASRFTIHATRGFKEAMVTGGGVNLRDVDPNTYASKITPGLYLAGEVLDLTGPSGGYNLQLAFSTGFVAGRYAARSLYAPSQT